ncbi:MAG TPA: TdeIII family type II restriction endonuclease [Candidatus Scalindua sp.]|nr:TdeIII family type II restriction endonuclease [Candidatus Scalindua sp.]
MSLSSKTAGKIAELLVMTIREKLRKYKPETLYMLFCCKLLGKDRYAMFSFVQSMNTTFGVSIWEQIAVILPGTKNSKK